MRPAFIPLTHQEYPPEAMLQRSADLLQELRRRRSVREFSPRPVPRQIIENCIRTAMTAPSGANMQPWHFVVVEGVELKKQIRQGAEKEEQEFYAGRASDEWLQALEPLGTDASKPFLETAPYLIAVFAQLHGLDADGNKIRHYYVNESVGIATGMLITAVHHAGLTCLTHTPAPMRFLNRILDRPPNEKPYLILVVGYPEEGATVPELAKKALEDCCDFV
jgi:nitroreductase